MVMTIGTFRMPDSYYEQPDDGCLEECPDCGGMVEGDRWDMKCVEPGPCSCPGVLPLEPRPHLKPAVPFAPDSGCGETHVIKGVVHYRCCYTDDCPCPRHEENPGCGWELHAEDVPDPDEAYDRSRER